MTTRIKALLRAVVLMFACCLPAEAQQADVSFRLAPLKLEGARRYTPDDVAKLSGLRAGQMITVANLQVAADRLAASGLFKHLKYRYVTDDSQITVTFEVEEGPSTVPVVFDNFIWFPDDDVTATVRRDVPAFDGSLPDTEGAPDLVIRSLQAMIAARGIPGTVVMMPHSDLRTKTLRYLFSVKDPAPVICEVSVESASVDVQREALGAAKAVSGQAYSHFYLREMSRGTLLDIYRRRGRLRADIVPVATKSESAVCSGANVRFQVAEGPVYKWAGAEWSGNAAVRSPDLDKLLGMRAGEIADDSKVRDGIRRIAGIYGRNGYVLFTAMPSPRLDDAAQTAVFEFTVSEGPQFRMGKLEMTGLPEREAEALRKHWTLETGATFDDGYVSEFLAKGVPSRRPGGAGPEIRFEVDRAARVVHVRLVFQ